VSSTAGEAPRRGYPKGRATRQAIVDSGTAMFARSGYHAASLRDIAAHAGLTTAGVLHHFASKEELFAEVLARRDERVREAAGEAEGDGLLEQLRRVVAFDRNERQLAALVAVASAEATDPEHPAHAAFAERSRDDQRTIRAALDDARRTGLVRADLDLDTAARLIAAVVEGLRMQWLLDPATDMTAAFDEFVRGYLRGPGRGAI
jgi:AcrR family transcriptional regulator